MEHPDGCFHGFSKLPLELRLTIWNLSISNPRVVPIHLSAASPSEDPAATTAPQCVSPSPAPANLYACRESRLEALKHHRPSFGMYRSPGRILFNPRTDVLYFGRCEGYGASAAQFCTVMALCAPEDLARVRRLAINEAVFKVGCKYVHSLAADVFDHVRARMPELEELVFVPSWEAGGGGGGDEHGSGSVLVDVGFTEEMVGMAAQVQAAVHEFSERHPEWERPACRVMALGKGLEMGSGP